MKVLGAGQYRAEYTMSFPANVTGQRSAFVAKNGVFPNTDATENTAYKNNAHGTASSTVFFQKNTGVTGISVGQIKTVEFWYKPIAYGSSASGGTDTRKLGMIVQAFSGYVAGSSIFPGLGINVGQNSDGKLQLNFPAETGSGYVWPKITPDAVSLNAWHHIAFTISVTATMWPTSITYAFYVDGSRVRNGDVTPVSNYQGNGESDGFAIKHGHHTTVFGLDDIRVSNNERYTGTSYIVPTAGLTADGTTDVLYKCNDRAIGSYAMNGSTDPIADTTGTKNMLPVSGSSFTSAPAIEGIAAQAYEGDFAEKFADAVVDAAQGGLATVISSSETIELAANDYVELYGWQNSGVSLQPFGGGRKSKFKIQKIAS
jgi:hypothetical protein